MDPIALTLAFGSLFFTLGCLVVYFAKIADAKISLSVAAFVAQMLVGLGLGAGAILWALQHDGLSALTVVPVALAGFMAIFFLWLISMRKTPIGDIRVKVGDKLLPFQATTAEGVSFDSGETEGQRLLLKFFRGAW